MGVGCMLGLVATRVKGIAERAALVRADRHRAAKDGGIGRLQSRVASALCGVR